MKFMNCVFVSHEKISPHNCDIIFSNKNLTQGKTIDASCFVLLLHSSRNKAVLSAGKKKVCFLRSYIIFAWICNDNHHDDSNSFPLDSGSNKVSQRH